jgi:hypothetical protein
MSETRNTRPILVTGSHRSGSTWVGKMLDLSYQTYYLSKIFNPDDQRLSSDLIKMDVLCLIRHPAAFATSLKKASWPAGFQQFLDQPRLMEDWLHPSVDQLKNPSNSFIERAALVWLCIYHVLISYAQRHPEWMFWRLEDISVDPVAAFEDIYRQLDLQYTQKIKRHIWEYSNDTNPVEASPQNLHLIRRNSRATQNKWRSVLTPDEITAIRRIVEPVSHLYYSDEDW